MSVNRYYSNTAVVTALTAGINNSETSIAVDSVSGFPVSYPYTLVIDEGQVTEELVKVTAAVGTTLTVVRGVDNTSASTHSASAAVRHAVSAQDFREPQEHIAAPSAVHGVTGSVVGDDDTQTLTNKDLSSTTNTFPNELNPVGAILMWGTASAPTGWLLCDGTAVSRTTYADLFAVLGTTYGAGNGTTTFNLPNLKGRVVVGKDAAQTEFDTLGETGGAKTHTLSTAELPSHTHTINHGHSASSGTESADHAHSGTTGGGGSHAHNIPNSGSFYKDNVVNSPSAWTDSAGDHSTDAAGDHAHSFSTGGRSAAHTHGITVNDFNGSSGSAGSGSAHNNLQPYIVLNYIIKA